MRYEIISYIRKILARLDEQEQQCTNEECLQKIKKLREEFTKDLEEYEREEVLV